MARRDWTYEETLLAFGLYLSLEKKEITERNKKVIAFADLLGRTPAAVKMKLWNIASKDPNWTAEGKAGLPGAAEMIGELWQEFQAEGESFVEKAIDALQGSSANHSAIQYAIVSTLEGEDVPASTTRRKGQSYFRNTLKDNYRYKCCATGLAVPELLVASHIKPWRVSDPRTERLNPTNGLLLNALHDKAFDKGFITLDKELKIRVSPLLGSDSEAELFLRKYDKSPITLPKAASPGKEFIEYHNDVIFRRSA